MKNLFKTAAVFLLGVITVTYAVFPILSSAQTVSQSCDSYSLVWASNGNPVDPANLNDFTSPPTPTTALPGSFGLTTSTDSTSGATVPTYTLNTASSTHAGDTIRWACSNGTATGGGLFSTTEQQNPPGMESCLAAAQIAQKYAWYTTLGSSTQLEKNIGLFIMPKIKNLLSNALGNYKIDLSTLVGTSTLKSIFGTPNLSINQLTNFFNSNSIQGALQNIFSHSALGQSVNNQISNIRSDVENQMKQELTKLGLNVSGQLTQFAKSALGLSTQVPVYDQSVQSAVNQNTEATKQVIAEQKNQELIADTRAKCNLLLQDTVETIKRSLLYQFTTETVDWIQGGGIKVSSDGKITVNPPQYFQRPLKDLADAGLNAVDNIISQVAPQLCQPFQLAVTLQIPTTNRQSNPFYQQASCTLNQVVSNIQGFYTNFRSGNWLGYQEIWMPQNNYYGASLITQQMAAQANDVAQQNLQSQMSQSNGYKNTYACTEWDEYKEQPSYYCNSGSSNTRLENGVCYALNNTFSDPNGMVVPTDAQSMLTPSAFFDQSSGKIYTSSNKSTYYQCASAIVTQPSNIAAGLAQQASQVDTNAIINAQDLTDIGTIIQNAVINKLTKVGISGIRGILQSLPAIQEKWQLLKP
jgi:hypothetical protein